MLRAGHADRRGRTGWPDPLPPIIARGWDRFRERAPYRLAAVVRELYHEAAAPLVDALAATPFTFLHGDWKCGNLGTTADGRTVLLDWAGPGAGPAPQDLCWYLAINQELGPSELVAWRLGMAQLAPYPGADRPDRLTRTLAV